MIRWGEAKLAVTPACNRGNLDLVVTPLHFTVWNYVVELIIVLVLLPNASGVLVQMRAQPALLSKPVRSALPDSGPAACDARPCPSFIQEMPPSTWYHDAGAKKKMLIVVQMVNQSLSIPDVS